ncbi:MAG: glycosyltransferase [Actinomycetota bacterium]|nr:glycosyltransferase [Actinomycetota bacterium]
MTTVAIVHERFTELGGSEKVVAEMHALWPQARIHTTVVDRRCLPAGLVDAEIVPSPLQRLYRGGPTYAHLLPLMPWAMSRLELDDVDVVVTSHHAFSNRVPAAPGRLVVSYTHTPARWMWDPYLRRTEVEGYPGRAALAAFSASQRSPDRRAARRLRSVVANSTHVAARIRRWWETDAVVIHPPVDTDAFTPSPSTAREDFFLLAGRLVPYKRPEVAVLAARAAGVRLVVAGDGRARQALEHLGGDVEFLGAVDHPTLVELFRKTRALVFPGEEDFGLVPVEAQACGAPVIALGRGGVTDTVVAGTTGLTYAAPAGGEVAALAACMAAFDADAFDPMVIRSNAEQFSRARFRDRLSAHVESVVGAR